MKLVVAIVHNKDAQPCCDALTTSGFSCTRLASYGGFLEKDNATVLIGVDEKRVDDVINVIRTHARQRLEVIAGGVPAAGPVSPMVAPPVEVEVGGATVFVVDVERFEKI